jgi:nicotinamidase-related amidase
MIDCQNTYRQGTMQLEGVEEALNHAARLLQLARDNGIPIFHIQHDGGEGSPYDLTSELGQIASEVAPQDGENIITKHLPNAFVQTPLDEYLRSRGIENVILAGFMTHMCVNSTAHGAFNLGYRPTIVAKATATRGLETADGVSLSAQQVHDAALASTRDLYACVVDEISDLPV